MYLAVGTIGFAYHFRELLVFQDEGIWVELTEFLAIVSEHLCSEATTGRAGLGSLGLHAT